jgi:hypothetical protein
MGEPEHRATNARFVTAHDMLVELDCLRLQWFRRWSLRLDLPLDWCWVVWCHRIIPPPMTTPPPTDDALVGRVEVISVNHVVHWHVVADSAA